MEALDRLGTLSAGPRWLPGISLNLLGLVLGVMAWHDLCFVNNCLESAWQTGIFSDFCIATFFTTCKILPHSATFYHILPHLTTSHHILPHSATFHHIPPHLSESYHKRTWLATFTTGSLPCVQWASSEKATAAFEFRMWMCIVQCLAFGLSRSNPQIMTRLFSIPQGRHCGDMW
jgi:hypothetical protein